MKYLKDIDCQSGNKYKLYVSVTSESTRYFHIKWKKKFLCIPYWCFVRTNYFAQPNHKLEFHTYQEAIIWISSIEYVYNLKETP